MPLKRTERAKPPPKNNRINARPRQPKYGFSTILPQMLLTINKNNKNTDTFVT